MTPGNLTFGPSKCDQTIFQKKFAIFSHQSLTHTSKTFYLIASFYLITPRHHLLTTFKKLQERTKFISNWWEQTLSIRNQTCLIEIINKDKL